MIDARSDRWLPRGDCPFIPALRHWPGGTTAAGGAGIIRLAPTRPRPRDVCAGLPACVRASAWDRECRRVFVTKLVLWPQAGTTHPGHLCGL